MIRKIGFKNIRVFKELHEFEIKPLTVLTGANNSGKSTIYKMFKLLNSNFKSDNNKPNLESLKFENEIVSKIGEFESNLNRSTKSDAMTFSFEYDSEYGIPLGIELTYGKKINNIEITSAKFFHDKKLLFSFNYQPIQEYVAQKNIEGDYSRSNELIASLNRNGQKSNFSTIHNYLISIRDSGMLQNKIFILDTKLEKKEALTKEELVFVNELKNKGIIFNRNKVHDIMDKKIENTPPEWQDALIDPSDFFYNIWNENTNQREPFNINQKKFTEVFFDHYSEDLLFNLPITNLVLGDPDILNTSITDLEIQEIKSVLIAENIFTKADFVKAQLEFENYFVIKFLTFLNNNYKNFEDFNFVTARSIFDLKINTEFENVKSLFTKVYKTPLATLMFKELCETIIKKEIGHLSPLEVDIFKGKIKVSEVTTIDPDLKECGIYDGKSLFEIYFESIKTVFENVFTDSYSEISNFMNKINFNLQDRLFTRNFIFSEEKNSNNPFLLFGTKSLDNDLKEETLHFINKWLKNFKIGQELITKPIKVQYDIIGVTIFIKDFQGNEIQLNDNGLGINKIIQTIITLAFTEKDSILLFEEPESNLHPSLQSKLAELFCDAFLKFGCYFLIETHSEYLIRKIQYLIASKKGIVSGNVAVYYLYDPNFIPEGEEQVYKLDIRNDGFMNNDFGEGFFDEASNLSLGLINLN
ncbi:AAA family ATPase [Formosa sediminum]|uniref:AAA family ATPase n=1 Tax=Formosa sediminum TaxID=2594004 RepID=A0A516GUX6_9FLAO|nr:AAA family ATPase [Formosa sediminum]QDO95306.1 AAA family ATPase [Formosa sediminum]